MELLNGDGFPLEAFQSADTQRRRYLVVVTKATYAFPTEAEGLLLPAVTPVPIYASDVFTGEPGESAPLFECDYALRKPKCDVIIKATAYAPRSQPVRRLKAGFRVGDCRKQVRVVGDRRWRWGLLGRRPGRPKKFTVMPITYDRAFGGTWAPPEGRRGPVHAYLRNPVGCGFAKGRYKRKLKHTPVPNLEKPGQRIRRCRGRYRPWSFGPIGRNWKGRVEYAGTYDQHWQDQIFPHLPPDFDERFNQCAPRDQQIDYPTGGEVVELWNLHPEHPHVRFALPELALPMVVLTAQGEVVPLEPVVDCLTIDADAQVVTVLWRASLPIKRSLREIDMVVAGSVCKRWWKSRVLGTADCGCGGIETDDEDRAPVTLALET